MSQFDANEFVKGKVTENALKLFKWANETVERGLIKTLIL